MSLVTLLLDSARRFPDRPAVAVGKNVVCCYGEFARKVQNLSLKLQTRHGLGAGDRVALAMKNCPEYFEILFACWHAGLVAVPINAKLHTREFAYILENSGAKLCFVTPDLEGALSFFDKTICIASREFSDSMGENQIPVETRPDDPAWLFYTSGTTGVPKGAMLTHRNLAFATQAYFDDIVRLTAEDAILHAAPLSHGSGLYALPHFAAGAANVIPESAGFDAAEVFDNLRAWKSLSFFAAPTMVVRLLAARTEYPREHLKALIYGGGPMYVPDCLRAIEFFGPRLYQLYGQGESPMTITGLSQEFHSRRERLGTVGKARSRVEVQIVDEKDQALPAGETGEVVTRSDCVMAGYWRNPEASAQALRVGWLHTGDLGSMDAEGFLTLRDRSKDLIISGGANIYPREIEEVLLTHPAVAECSVVGRPHAEWGEEVVAFVVKKAEVSEETLDQHCLNYIARFKRPREYRFVDALPKNNYGKVLKTELRKRLAG